MRYAVLTWIAVAACSNPEDPPTRSTLETDATTYVASAASTPGFDYAFSIALTLRNTSEWVIRVSRCTATTTYPVYAVESRGTELAAWSPTVTCAAFGTPYVDILPGATHSETIELRAPWQRQFNGQPVGAIEGSFYIVLETQLCPRLTASGQCQQPSREYVISNNFTVSR